VEKGGSTFAEDLQDGLIKKNGVTERKDVKVKKGNVSGKREKKKEGQKGDQDADS